MELIGKKISVMKKEHEISIVISVSDRPGASYALLFWMLCWFVCGPLLALLLWDNPEKDVKIFLFVFGGFWLYFLVRVYYAFMWKRYGREVIKIKEGKVFIKKDIRKKGKVHVYDLDFIKDLRKRDLNASSIGTALSSVDWLSFKEALAFDFSGKEIRIGYDLNAEDAQELFRLLRHHFIKKVT